MIVHETIDVPSRSEMVIHSQLVIRSLGPAAKYWTSEASEIRPGLQMACVLALSNSPIIPIPLMNINEEIVILEKDEYLDELCAVQICEDDEDTTKEPHETIIQEMVARVDPSIDNDTREELKQMLTSYKNILSNNDYDLEGAIGVLHNIDNGDTKPLRQALRRQPINHQ